MKRLLEGLKSLRFQIFLLLLIFGIVPGFFLRAGLLSAYEHRAVEVQTSDITGQAQLLATQIASSNYLSDQSEENISVQLDQMSTMYDGRILLVDAAFTVVEDNYQLDEGKVILLPDVIRAYRGETVQTYDRDNHYIEVILPIIDQHTSGTRGVLMVSESTDSMELNRGYLKQWALLIQLLIGVMVIVIGCSVSVVMTKPLKRLAKSVRDVHDGYENDFKGSIRIRKQRRFLLPAMGCCAACRSWMRHVRSLYPMCPTS